MYGRLVVVLERLRQRTSQASDIWNLRERKKLQSAKLLIVTSILSSCYELTIS